MFVIFHYLGRYSVTIADLALKFPRSFHQYNNLVPIMQENLFNRQAVCKKCESIYKFEDCVTKVGTRTIITTCKSKQFQKSCNHLLMKEVITSGGTKKFYPHKVYCFISLISYLQTLIMRSGFVEQCESTRNLFSPSGYSDIYDGSLWKEFLTVDNIPFLSECYNYGLLLNIDWLQPYKAYTVFCRDNLPSNS